jgi:hypothetical protein
MSLEEGYLLKKLIGFYGFLKVFARPSRFWRVVRAAEPTVEDLSP